MKRADDPGVILDNREELVRVRLYRRESCDVAFSERQRRLLSLAAQGVIGQQSDNRRNVLRLRPAEADFHAQAYASDAVSAMIGSGRVRRLTTPTPTSTVMPCS